MSNESRSVRELNDLLERGEISPEAYAEYAAADAGAFVEHREPAEPD